LSAQCEDKDRVLGAFPLLPRLHVPETDDSSPLEFLREVFVDNPLMQITRDRDGTIRMVETGILSNLLKTKIRHIHFESRSLPSQNASLMASAAMLRAILRAPEVVAFMESNQLVFPFNGTGGSFDIESSAESGPHFDIDMNNLTLAEALDKVLETFPGLWLYEICTRNGEKKSVVGIWYFDLQSPGPYMAQLVFQPLF
jgi:hypothetical protein